METTQNKGYTFVTTYTNKEVSIIKPQEDTIDIYDIAYTLSHINRWNGNISFTVAQHSLLVCKLLALETTDREVLLLGLMHDSAEAYIGDMPKPIKDKQDTFLQVEEEIEATILRKLNLGHRVKFLIDEVRGADRLAMELEAYYFGRHTTNFKAKNTEVLSNYVPLLEELLRNNADIIEHMFIEKYKELGLGYAYVLKHINIYHKGQVVGYLVNQGQVYYLFNKDNDYIAELPLDLSNYCSIKVYLGYK